MRLILKTYLTPRNKIKTITQLAISAFQYSCGTINWPQTEMNKLDIKIRKLNHPQNVLQKSVHPENVPAEMRMR